MPWFSTKDMRGIESDIAFRFDNPTDEDLPALSRLAHTVSAQECGACRNYHVRWPYLRSIGASGSGPEHCWALSRETIKEGLAGRSESRWLIAGAADAGVPALVRSCCLDLPDQKHTVTLVDRCETPLALSRAYADAVGAKIEIVNDDLMAFSRDGAFDVVVFHYTFLFFDEEDRIALLRRTRQWLAPGGKIFVFANYDGEQVDRKAASEVKRQWRRSVVLRAVEDGELVLPEDIETFLWRIENSQDPARADYKKKRWNLADVRDVIHRGGFTITRHVDLPESEAQLAAIGAESKPRVLFVAEASTTV